MQYEIRNANLSDTAALKQLWSDSFGDSQMNIDRFFDKVYMSNRAYVAVSDEKVVAMMYLLTSTFRLGEENYKAGYVYAVATDADYRGNGIMKKLEEYLCSAAIQMEIKVLALVPASKSLFKLYEKIGYKTAFYKYNMMIIPEKSESFELLNFSDYCRGRDNEKTLVLNENSSDKLKPFTDMRNRYLKDFQAAFDLNESYKSYRFELLNDEDLLLYRDNLHIGYIAGIKRGHNYEIVETDLPLSVMPRVSYALTERYFNLKKVALTAKTGRRRPYGMLKLLDDEINIYDAIKANPYMNLMLE